MMKASVWRGKKVVKAKEAFFKKGNRSKGEQGCLGNWAGFCWEL